MPTIRPKIAPNVSDGMNRPHGTFIPKVNIVRTRYTTNAKISNQIALYTPGPAAAISMAEFTSVKFRL